jgi:hypothetical protein
MANKVYQHDETAITWLASGGTHAFTPTSLGSGAGRQGAYRDFGTSARSRLFAWRAWIKPGGTRVVGEIVRVYLATGDGTIYDNDDGTGDIAVSSVDKLRNLQQIGSIVIDENAAVTMAASGVVEIGARHAAPVFWNGTNNTLSSTAADFGFSLVPIPDEIQ